MKNLSIWRTAAALLLLLTASCNPEHLTADRAGRPGGEISFGVSARKASHTKTSYSGITDEQNYERIDWIAGDRIRITCQQANPAAADYDVTASGSGDGRYHHGTIAASETHMKWGAQTQHTFYAMYPVPGDAGVQEGTSIDGNTVSAVLPAAQSSLVTLTDELGKDYRADMKLAYMTAAATGEPGAGTVELSFSPMVTTFHITVTNPTAAPMHATRVMLSTSGGTPLCGTVRAVLSQDGNRTFSYKLPGGSFVNKADYAVTEGNSSVYMDFSPALEIPAGQGATLTLFTIPEDIGRLTLTVVSEENGTCSLDMKESGGEWLTFTGRNKHDLNNIGLPVVEYRLSVDKAEITYDYTGERTGSAQDFTVTSGRIVNGASETLSGWVTMLRTGPGENDWTPLTDALPDERYAWLAGLPASSEGLAASDVSVLYQKDISASPVVSHVENLRRTPEAGTQAEPLDLSRWDFVNRTQDAAQYTANCYVIQAPGWYMFPLVYGNAVENDAVNQGSFVGKNGAGHLNNFGNYNNNSIRNAWIERDRAGLSQISCASLRIQWQQYTDWDGTTETPVTSGGMYSDASYTDPGVITDLGIVDGPGGRYVRFRLDPERILPGNAMLCALNASGDVLWSWHLWITDQSMDTAPVNNGTTDYAVLPVNLGWTDLGKGQAHDSRSAVLRFDSSRKEGLHSGEMTVVQAKGEEVSTRGWSTYYQWGRKDPFVEGLLRVMNDDTNTGGSIRHPSNLYWDTSTYRLLWSGSLRGTYYDWVIENYNNLWDSQCTKYGIRSTVTMNTNAPEAPSGNLPTYKTVYDPSPRRFCVSPDFTWDGFPDSKQGGFDGGYFLRTTTGATVFFPAAGYIDHETGTLQAELSGGHYWTNHATYGVQCRISYTLNFSPSAVNTLYYTNMNRADARSVRSVAYDNAYTGPGIEFPDADATVDFAAMSLTDSQDMTAADVTAAPFTITFTKNDGSSAPTYHSQQTGDNPTYYTDAVYLYSAGSILSSRRGNAFTVSATGTERIVSIQLSLGEEDGASISADSGTYDADTLEWNGDASSVTFTLGNNGNMRSLQALTISYNFN